MYTDKLTSQISIDKDSNELLKEITQSINTYLIKNKGNAADFHLLKNIVDRHLDTIDEEVGHMLPVPLYLGLAGTMIGIITGLMSINGDVTSDGFVNSISIVVGNIKWAMICSLLGLLLTTYLSAWHYRRAKARMERQKNDFLDYLQSELLPHLNEDATATLLNMQANLQNFNKEFKTNLQGFSGILKEVHSAFDSQVELVKQLKNMDLVKMSSLNIHVLDKLHQSMDEFDKFTRYLSGMNAFVMKVTSLTNSVNSQLDRTEVIEDVARGIKQNIERNETVMQMLNEFLQRVDANAALVEASQKIDDTVKVAMEQMRAHVQSEVENLNTYTKKAADDLETLMQKEKGHLNRLDNLDNLKTLAIAVNQMVEQTTTVNTNLAKRISSLSDAIKSGPRNNGGLPSWLLFIVSFVIVFTCGAVLYKMFFEDNNKNENVQTEIVESILPEAPVVMPAEVTQDSSYSVNYQ